MLLAAVSSLDWGAMRVCCGCTVAVACIASVPIAQRARDRHVSMPPLQAEGDPNQQKTQQLCAKIIASCTQRLKAAGAAKKAEKAAALAAPVPVTARLSMLVMALAYIVYAYRIEAVRVLLGVLLVLLLLLAARLVACIEAECVQASCFCACVCLAIGTTLQQPAAARLAPA